MKNLLEDGFLARWDPIAEVLLYLLHQVLLVHFDKRESCALIVTTGCPPHSVDIGLNIGRKVKVDDVGNELKIDSTHYASLLVLVTLSLN